MTTRSRWITAMVLIGATLALGAASRVAWTSDRISPPAGGSASFSAAPAHPVSFTGQLDRTAVLQGSDGMVRMELVVRGDDRQDRHGAIRLPTDLVVVLDRSGSMNGAKMVYARAAIRELVSRLGAQDRFSLVSYANGARIDVALANARPGTVNAWTRVIESVAPNGGTNLASGVDLGLQIVESNRASGHVPRVILISDGLANQGDTSRAGLLARAGRAARGEYVLSTVGVGDDFNESLMTSLADAGTGNYYYLESAVGLARVFAGEFEAASTTLAHGLRIGIRPGSGVRVVEAAGYPLEREGREVSFRPGALFQGQERRVWVTLQVPTGAGSEFDLGRFSLDYTREGQRKSLEFSEMPRVASVLDRDEFLANLEPEAWERSVVKEEYGAMQNKVADYVREGRRDLAVQEIDGYVRRNSELNDAMNSAPVARQIGEADALMIRVEESFRGADQDQKRKRASKEIQQQSLDGRRVGSKKDAGNGGAP